jgi:hypothetical protein
MWQWTYFQSRRHLQWDEVRASNGRSVSEPIGECLWRESCSSHSSSRQTTGPALRRMKARCLAALTWRGWLLSKKVGFWSHPVAGVLLPWASR